MAEFTALSLWTDADKITAELIGDGWRSPDTYSSCFGPLRDMPAVYLFLCYKKFEWKSALVGYVGMATRLQRRLQNHEVFREVRIELWPQRWFKPVCIEQLRETERHYIQRFDPPWNLTGKKRGLR